MFRVRTILTGWSGAPGLHTAYYKTSTETLASANAVLARVRSAWTPLAGILPTGFSAQVSEQVDIIDPATGVMTGALIGNRPGEFTAGAAQFTTVSPAVAGMVVLNTGVFDGGRQIRGRSFISPLHTAAMTTGGILSSTAVGALQSFGAALLGTVDLEPIYVVWRRPRLASVPPAPALIARVGRTANVTSISVPTRAAVLRSRRD